MNLKLLGLATVTTLPVLSLTAGSAYADNCKDPVSLIQLPGKTCLDLSYLTRLGASRRGVSISKDNLSRAIQLNQQKDVSVTDTIGDSHSFVSTTTSIRENPTSGLQSIKEGMLTDAAASYRQAISDSEIIEQDAFRRQIVAMSHISKAFSHR